jgi:hypothetical protein
MELTQSQADKLVSEMEITRDVLVQSVWNDNTYRMVIGRQADGTIRVVTILAIDGKHNHDSYARVAYTEVCQHDNPERHIDNQDLKILSTAV